VEFGTEFVGVLLDAAAVYVLELLEAFQLEGIEAVRIVNVAAGVGEGNHLTAQLQQLLHRMLRHVAGP
jgi:hypothetical protein